MKIVLSENEVKDAVGLYLSFKPGIKPSDDIKIKIRRRSMQTEDVGSIVVEYQTKKGIANDAPTQ